MKKNKMMRIASVLLVAVLLSTCAISGTFAKYVTTAEGTDTARVAKWGVTVTAAGTTFSNAYAKDDSGFTGITNSVVSSDSTTNVVAPGTKGDLSNITFGGTPEVAVKITYDATLDLTGWTVESADYCPIVFKVTAAGTPTTYKIDGTDITSVAELIAAVQDAIKGVSASYPANSNLSGIANPLAVSWEWPFTGDDVKDTALGNAETAATIALTVSATVTQID